MSPLGDRGIIVTGVSLLNSNHTLIEHGTEKKNCQQIDKMKIGEQEKEAIIGFHAVTKNDCTSSRFGKGKCKCWGKHDIKLFLYGNCKVFRQFMGRFPGVIH